MNKIIHVDSAAKSVEMATAKSMEISKRQQQTQLEVALDITRKTGDSRLYSEYSSLGSK